jgi:hypothetical protein
MVLERIYAEINWTKSIGLINILKPEGKLAVYNEGKENEQVLIEAENPEVINSKEVELEKNIQEMKNGRKKAAGKERIELKRIQDMLKKQYEKDAINKFITRNERIVEKRHIYNEKKRNPKAIIEVSPTNIKGYKWKFDAEDKEKEFSEDDVMETLECRAGWDLAHNVLNRRLPGVLFQNPFALVWLKTNTKASGKLPRNFIMQWLDWAQRINSESS